ncbi:GNAT family N-acetyltransferase [Alkaliphilus peptidifermentans]|uniref:Acetyltransferase (GNAT) family protein n=1 Tax=Alkaliphilus peptidifermentans DSM 18978 TaxID=1120976 RepID=A0A1G5HPX1_9FIRM|nr:GNAT family N-acetyltransferase [Alkaliphilus peptidifermentans]SCY65787.1 Acetyltransferase (GNAT) family protein [Alkaliphilus peptidifermentans DSM 18978]
MLNFRIAKPEDKEYFVEDYLKRYGGDIELANKHAKVCIEVHRSIILHNDDDIIGSVTWAIREGIKLGLVVIFQMSIGKAENRGKGYGGMLVKHCIRDIETFFGFKGYNLRRIFIGINEGNLAARNIYKKSGFKIIAELKDHIIKNEKELIYAKDYF